MKFDKPFHIKLQPNYVIKEPVDINELEKHNQSTKELGGLITGPNNYDEGGSILRNGGRMNWFLYEEPNAHKSIVNVSLMRIWALQLVTQMINEKAFVNEMVSEPKFNINDEDKNILLNVIKEMNEVLNDELEGSADSMIMKKKNKFNF